MPLLRYLDLQLLDSSAHAVSCGEVSLLRTVVLNYNAASSVVLPWAQLTSLTLLRVYPYECVPILQQTLSLVHCKLELFDSTNDQLNDITLPILIVPALRSLEISEDFLYVSAIQSLTAFISKSGCKLEEVQITGQDQSPSPPTSRHFPRFGGFYSPTKEGRAKVIPQTSRAIDSQTIDGTGS
ncbi:hypothetical protein B0H13DRAFT_2326445 [Mycena leptocephala]|nr:hypothetical protein B0H13DRAFT_2326445 [Mycena leptocephala]